jgi:hypothetical protein
MAQDPPGTLPTAFQERYCLTERHVRCEMYKYAQSARETALGQEGIPAAQVKSARFRPSVRSVPLTLGPSRGAGAAARRSRPPTVVVVTVAGAAALIILVLLGLALGGSGGGPGADASGSPVPTDPAASTPRATARPTAAASVAPDTSTVPPDLLPGGTAVVIEYRVQEGEALVKIAETFGTTRGRILDANPGMRDRDPYTEPDMIIVVPVSAAMSAADIESRPGFVGYVDPQDLESPTAE